MLLMVNLTVTDGQCVCVGEGGKEYGPVLFTAFTSVSTYKNKLWIP